MCRGRYSPPALLVVSMSSHFCGRTRQPSTGVATTSNIGVNQIPDSSVDGRLVRQGIASLGANRARVGTGGLRYPCAIEAGAPARVDLPDPVSTLCAGTASRLDSGGRPSGFLELGEKRVGVDAAVEERLSRRCFAVLARDCHSHDVCTLPFQFVGPTFRGGCQGRYREIFRQAPSKLFRGIVKYQQHRFRSSS